MDLAAVPAVGRVGKVETLIASMGDPVYPGAVGAVAEYGMPGGLAGE